MRFPEKYLDAPGEQCQNNLSSTRLLKAMTRLAICVPDYGFDPTEAAIPWKCLVDHGWEIDVVTETGQVPQCDKKMLSGLLADVMGSKQPARVAYESFSTSSSFLTPKSWSNDAFDLMQYDVLLLPGGHDKGVKQIIESESLKKHLPRFFEATKGDGDKKVVAAICHGVMVLSTTTSPVTSKSLLYDRATTTLPVHLERLAYLATAPVLGDYYRTYPGKYTANLVQSALKEPAQFIPGPFNLTASDERYICLLLLDIA
ncbi:class I glutamine amidotransferase-like protein [Flagelloscypha sp. PMI_526]|nr:class I glutamine amidotransferase-like protein [Flagelloscypha sp. PMI_526]